MFRTMLQPYHVTAFKFYRSIKDLDTKLQKIRPFPNLQHAACVKFHNNLNAEFNILSSDSTRTGRTLVRNSNSSLNQVTTERPQVPEVTAETSSSTPPTRPCNCAHSQPQTPVIAPDICTTPTSTRSSRSTYRYVRVTGSGT